MNYSLPEKIKLAVMGILFLICFWPTFLWMNVRFSEPESFYAHGYLIPFICAFLLYQKKDEFNRAPVQPLQSGLYLLVGSLLLQVFSVFFEINFLGGLSLIGVLAGLILFNFGKSFFKTAAFALFFLSFMVPLPVGITLGISFQLKIISANLACFLMKSIVPLKQSGSFIHLPNGVLMVGAPCSGLKSMITLSALSLLFGYVSGFKKKGLLVFFLSSMPIAIIANVLRIMLLIFVFYVYGEKATMGKFHDFSGFLVFVFAFICLVILKKGLAFWQNEKQSE